MELKVPTKEPVAIRISVYDGPTDELTDELGIPHSAITTVTARKSKTVPYNWEEALHFRGVALTEESSVVLEVVKASEKKHGKAVVRMRPVLAPFVWLCTADCFFGWFVSSSSFFLAMPCPLLLCWNSCYQT